MFDIPLDWIQLLSDRATRSHLWEFTSHPAAMCGKAIGGTDTFNAMIRIRAQPEDLAKWGTGWEYQDMLPYYMLNENNTDDRMLHSPLHSSVGAIQVTSVPPSARDPVADRFIAACEDSGHAFVPDFNDGRQSRVGAGRYQFDIRHGKRESSAASFFGYPHPCVHV